MGYRGWKGPKRFPAPFIRLRPNTLQLAAGMKGKVNRTVARQSEGGFGFGAIPL